MKIDDEAALGISSLLVKSDIKAEGKESPLTV